jgi:hypothetical protein
MNQPVFFDEGEIFGAAEKVRAGVSAEDGRNALASGDPSRLSAAQRALLDQFPTVVLTEDVSVAPTAASASEAVAELAEDIGLDTDLDRIIDACDKAAPAPAATAQEEGGEAEWVPRGNAGARLPRGVPAAERADAIEAARGAEDQSLLQDVTTRLAESASRQSAVEAGARRLPSSDRPARFSTIAEVEAADAPDDGRREALLAMMRRYQST